MFSKEQKEVMQKAIDTYGASAQMDMIDDY